MKVVLAVMLATLAFGLTGCASMYQSMGLATVQDLAARDKKIAALEERVTALAAEVQSAKTSAQKAEAAEALAKALAGRMDQLPQETLKRLAEILNKAAAETTPKP